jgi:hypothetical protein
MKQIALAVLLFTAALMGADLSGTYIGNIYFDGSDQPNDAKAALKQEGTVITGTIGPPDRQSDVTGGKIDGSKVTLETVRPDGNVKVVFDLTLDGDRLEGDVTMTRDGETRKAKIKLKRQ